MSKCLHEKLKFTVCVALNRVSLVLFYAVWITLKFSGLNNNQQINNQQRNEAGLAQYRRHTENGLLISYHCLYEASEKEVIPVGKRFAFMGT